MLGLFVILFYVLMTGLAVLCVMSRISPWIWAFPFLVTYIVGTILFFVRGDRIKVAEQREDDLHALPSDAPQRLEMTEARDCGDVRGRCRLSFAAALTADLLPGEAPNPWLNWPGWPGRSSFRG